MKDVNLDQLNSVFKKYMTNFVWAYQGDPSKVTTTLFTGITKPTLPKSRLLPKKKG